MRRFIFLVAVSISGALQAQNTSYMPMKLYMYDFKQLNPAMAALDDGQAFTLSRQVNQTELSGASQSFFLSYENYFNGINSGLSVLFWNEKTVVQTNNNMAVQLSRRLELGERRSLGLGLAFSRRKYIIDYAQVPPVAGADPVLSSADVGKSFDIDLGVNYRVNQFDVGASVANVLETRPGFRPERNFEFLARRTLKTFLAKKTDIGESLQLQSSLAFQSDFRSWVFDVNNTLELQRYLIGVNVRTMEGGTQCLVNAGFKIHDFLQFIASAYSEERSASFGEHGISGEAMLRLYIQN